jgi:hypothetical protein
MKKQLIKTLALASICVITHQASAYSTWSCLGEKMKWSSNSVTMRLASNSFSNSSWRSSMTTAISRLNQNPSRFRFSSYYPDTGVSVDNGQSEAWFTSNQSLLGGAPARAFVQMDCVDYWIFGTDVEITEADVIFDNQESYTTSMSKSSLWSHGGSFRPFQTTAIHELGHGAGLAHTNNTYNIMGQDWDHIHANGWTARSYLGEDAANGLVYLYGTTGSSAEDVGITHFKRTGSSGQYSAHGKTVLRTSGGGNLPSFTSGGETVYRVSRGQTIRLELSYENNGKTTRTEDIGFYVSTNPLITTSDRLVGTTSMTLSRNSVYTTWRYVTIPSNLTRGANYWVGAIIDRNGSLGEMTEANNATYLPIRIN